MVSNLLKLGGVVALCIIHVLIYGLMTLIRGFKLKDFKKIRLTSDFVGVAISWAAVLIISILITLLNEFLNTDWDAKALALSEKSTM